MDQRTVPNGGRDQGKVSISLVRSSVGQRRTLEKSGVLFLRLVAYVF